MNRAQVFSLALLTLVAITWSPAKGDLNILAIGDSLTAGSSARPSYRAYLDQSIRNFQALGVDDSDLVNVNWLGGNSNTATQPPGATAPFPVDNNWVDRHHAFTGISSLRYVDPRPNSDPTDPPPPDRLNEAKAFLAPTDPGDTNAVLLLLGTNDFNMRADGSNNGWNGDRFTPTDVFDSIQTIVTEFRALSLDIEILVAAIPPVDIRNEFTSTTAGRFWNESDRTISSGHQDLVHWDGNKFVIGPGADVGGARDASSNDVIDAVNDALMNWAGEAANDDVRFVNPFVQTNAYSLMGPTGSVNIGSGLNLTPDINGELDFLTDGVHLTDVGDQYYAASFWEQGLQATLSRTAAAQSVPEPSSFLFLGFVGVLSLSTKRYFSRREV